MNLSNIKHNVFCKLIENNPSVNDFLFSDDKFELFINNLIKVMNVLNKSNVIFDEKNESHMYTFYSNLSDIFIPHYDHNFSMNGNKWHVKNKHNTGNYFNMYDETNQSSLPNCGCSIKRINYELTQKDIRIFMQYILYEKLIYTIDKNNIKLNNIDELNDKPSETLNEYDNIKKINYFLYDLANKCQNGKIYLELLKFITKN